MNAYNLSIPQEHSYALGLARGSAVTEWLEMNPETVTRIIIDAQTWHVVLPSGDITATYNKISALTRETNGSFETEDGHTVNSLIDAISGRPEVTARFIDLSLQLRDQPVTALWSAIRAEFGPATETELQQGLQVLAIAGMQPEIVREITQNKESTPLPTIAKEWNSEAWYALVDRVCTAEGKLCVPQAIRGTATDPGNVQVKTAYAEKLHQVTSDIFATAVIGDRIAKGQVSGSVISNPKATSLFLQRTPDFDLRVNNVWSYEFGTSEEQLQVRRDLLPVQNIIRALEGQPDAAVVLLNDKIKVRQTSPHCPKMNSLASMPAHCKAQPRQQKYMTGPCSRISRFPILKQRSSPTII